MIIEISIILRLYAIFRQSEKGYFHVHLQKQSVWWLLDGKNVTPSTYEHAIHDPGNVVAVWYTYTPNQITRLKIPPELAVIIEKDNKMFDDELDISSSIIQ